MISNTTNELSVSVVIPTLNEESHLGKCLERLLSQNINEIIICDGQSSDETVFIAKKYARGALLVRVIQADPGRTSQLNAGAHLASGDVLWFLHADCLPAQESSACIRRTIANGYVGGAFCFGISESGFPFRLIEIGARVRNWLFDMPYGDQGYFVTRELFFQLGGFPVVSVMEDAYFYCKLKQYGPTVQLPEVLETSGRRWQIDGFLKTCVKHGILFTTYLMRGKPWRIS